MIPAYLSFLAVIVCLCVCMVRKIGALGLGIDRLVSTGPNIANVVTKHDLEIPDGYLVEIWGAEIMSTGFLDTGGVLQYFLSLDDDVIIFSTARLSDDVIFAGAFETLLVTTGGGMVVAADRVFFPKPILQAREITQWITYSAEDWSASTCSHALFFKYVKATDADIARLLLRRR